MSTAFFTKTIIMDYRYLNAEEQFKIDERIKAKEQEYERKSRRAYPYNNGARVRQPSGRRNDRVAKRANGPGWGRRANGKVVTRNMPSTLKMYWAMKLQRQVDDDFCRNERVPDADWSYVKKLIDLEGTHLKTAKFTSVGTQTLMSMNSMVQLQEHNGMLEVVDDGAPEPVDEK